MKQYVSKFSGKELDERLTRVDNIPTKTSELNNDSGFISEAEADNKYTDKNKTDVLEGDIENIKNKIDDLENNLLKKEIFEIDVIEGYISRLRLPKKNTIIHNLYENIEYNLHINIPFIKEDESKDGEFIWKITWDGEGNLEIQEINKELLLPEHFEIYQYVENTEIPTKISQLENDKNYITDSEVQNKLNSLNNTVDYFGDIIELNITSKGGNIDSVEVNEGILVDTLLTKANLDENGKIVTSQIPDYLLGQVMFGGLIYINNSVIPTVNFDAKYGPFSSQYVIIDIYEYYKYEGVYFIAHENGTILDIDVKVGDWIVSTGYSWEKIDNTDAVTSVAGLVGNVNASALASVLANIKDSNSLARKTDIPKKLSELENDIEIGGGGGSYDDSEIKEILSNIVDEEGYLYSNGEKVDMRFTRSLLPVGTSIPASANLNTIEYLKIGKYYCSLNADAKTIKNCPVNVAFSMEVFNPLGTNVDDETTRDYTYRMRILTQYDTGQQYMQFCRTSGTAGSWTYDSWYVTPRVKFALASSKNDGSAAIGATNKGVYVDSTGEIKAMSYTVAKSVPSNAVFTDTNTKVTAVGNHYAPAEDESQQIDAPSGEVVTGIKRDAAGHVVGVVSTPQTGGGDGYIGVFGDGYIESQVMEDGTYLTTNVAENLDEVSARGQLADAYDVKIYVDDNIGDSEYESAIADKTLTTPNAVGGIAKGTKVSDLEGKTFAEMFDDLLFPTVNPTFTAPSASIAFKSYSSTQEVGATGPTSANFTTGYNAGEIKLNGVKQANRGGTLNSTNSFIYVNGSSSNKTLPTKVTLGKTTFNYRAAYNQGPQPKNNKGGNYDSPLAAGTVDSSAITLNGTYPWYASTSDATSVNPVVKQSLVTWNATAGKMSTGQFTVQPSGTLPQVFKLPRKIDVLQLKNALNGNMENVEEINGVPKDYTESTETINIGGTNVTYYVYTYSGSTRGSVTLLAKF